MEPNSQEDERQPRRVCRHRDRKQVACQCPKGKMGQREWKVGGEWFLVRKCLIASALWLVPAVALPGRVWVRPPPENCKAYKSGLSTRFPTKNRKAMSAAKLTRSIT